MIENFTKKSYYTSPVKYNKNILPYTDQSYTLPKICVDIYGFIDREVNKKRTYLYKHIDNYITYYSHKCVNKHVRDGVFYLFHKKVYVYKKRFYKSFLRPRWVSRGVSGKVYIFEYWYDEEFI